MKNVESKLPAGWLRAAIRDIAEVRLGRQRSPANRAGDFARKYLRAANVTWRGLDLSDVNKMDFKPSEFETYKLRPGDILLSEASGSPTEVGKPAIWRDEIPDCCFQNTLIRVRSRGPSPDFLRYRFLHDALLGRFGDASKGVGIHHLGAERFGELEIELPPLAEQDRIVAELEKQFARLDAGVEALKRVQAQLKRYRASVLKAACEGRLVPTEAELARREKRAYEPADKLLARILKERRARWEADQLAKMNAAGKPPKDDEWKAKYAEPTPPDLSRLAALPEGWVWSTVAAVGDVLLGRRRAPEYRGSGPTRPYLRVANIKDDWVDLSDVESMDFDAEHFQRYELRLGDVLVCEGQSPERVGQSAIYRGGRPGLCFQATLNRFRSVPHGPSPEFAQTVFRSHVKTGVFMRLASITTNIAHLTLEKLLASPFPLPPLAEQKRVAAEVATKLSVAEAAEASIKLGLTRAARLKQGILRRAFDGTLVPQNPRDEPASKQLERIRTVPRSLSDPKVSITSRTKRPVNAQARKATA